MMKILLISLFMISANAHAQINWSNYATSFGKEENKPSLGVAIPYNGMYDNLDKNIVGISKWNPQYKLGIDTSLADQIPVYFVYDTAGINFLAAQINERNSKDFEFTVLLNNKTIITPWSHINQYTQIRIGNMGAGSGITGSYRARIGQYLVCHLRSEAGQIISSLVIYFKKQVPVIKSLSTSDGDDAFSNLVNTENYLNTSESDVGWHRQYISNLSGKANTLNLSYKENNVLIDIDAKVYKKDALEYVFYGNGKETRTWGANDFDNHYILLKNLHPGDYRIIIRF